MESEPTANSKHKQRALSDAQDSTSSGVQSGVSSDAKSDAKSDTKSDAPSDTQSDAPHSTLSGVELIKAKVKTLPVGAGVYRMIGADGKVLYAGKARNLRARVAAYTRLGGHTNRIANMIRLTHDMEFIRTRTEADALLLEANLIKKYKPRFNVLMRDDKSLPYILLAQDHAIPQLTKHRGARKRKGDYFGPFASAGAVNRTLNTLQRAFLLRTCTDSFYKNRSRPCMLYQIKRCSAPCTDEIAPNDYAALVGQAQQFLRGGSTNVQTELAEQMQTASAKKDYERAAQLRDRIRALTYVQSTTSIFARTIKEADIIALSQTGGQSCIQVFFFRASTNLGNKAYFPRHDRTMPAAEVLESFIVQFYENRPSAKQLLISHKLEGAPLIEEALRLKQGHSVKLICPRRGEKYKIVAHAIQNAREALARRLAESATQRKLLENVAASFKLDAPPQRIEVFDNSHLQGTNQLGAMIVATAEGFVKAQYRKFNIKARQTKPGDDYAMMREVLTRRYGRLVKEIAQLEQQHIENNKTAHETVEGHKSAQSHNNGNKESSNKAKSNKENGNKENGNKANDNNNGNHRENENCPDLILIDGGKGQLSVAQEVMAELGLEHIPLVAIAKGASRNGRERFFMAGRPPFTLANNSLVLYYMQRLRDEAHRFAIGGHRAKRHKDIRRNPLDNIPGIGAKRKKALLYHFGSAQAVMRADLQDLEKVENVSKKTAQTIYDYFNETAH